MKLKNIKLLFTLCLPLVLGACSEDDLSDRSIFENTEIESNEFDKWLITNYTDTYNLDFKYRLEDKETDNHYNLVPADYMKSIAMAKMTKHLWMESYDEILGPDFMKSYCPRIIQLIGSPAYNTQGSIVLGTAEGGLKVTLYNVNNINLKHIDVQELNHWYFHTMHHEFAHILHQTKEFTPDYNLITKSNYQSTSWVNLTDQEALDLGFITPYASMEVREDFVEMFSTYVTISAEEWNTIVGHASKEGQGYLSQKLDIVKDYMLTAWNIDMDKLREVVLRRSAEVQEWNVDDLTSLN